jgi:hypothetical protein
VDRVDTDKDEVLPADGTSAGYDVPSAATGARLLEDRGVGLVTEFNAGKQLAGAGSRPRAGKGR